MASNRRTAKTTTTTTAKRKLLLEAFGDQLERRTYVEHVIRYTLTSSYDLTFQMTEDVLLKGHVFLVIHHSRELGHRISDGRLLIADPSEAVSPTVFAAIIRWMYGRDVDADIEAIELAARQLHFTRLVDECEIAKRLAFASSEAAAMHEYATRHGHEDLRKRAYETMRADLKVCSAARAFLRLPVDVVHMLLSDEHLLVNSELNVLDAALRWLCHEWDSRLSHAALLIAAVRFESMSTNELVRVTDDYKRRPNLEARKIKSILRTSECRSLLLDAFRDRLLVNHYSCSCGGQQPGFNDDDDERSLKKGEARLKIETAVSFQQWESHFIVRHLNDTETKRDRMMDVFESLRNDQFKSETCEIELSVEGRSFLMHRFLLLYHNPSLAIKAASDGTPNRRSIVHLDGVSARVFDIIYRWMYADDFESIGSTRHMTLENVREARRFAEKNLFKEFASRCSHLMESAGNRLISLEMDDKGGSHLTKTQAAISIQKTYRGYAVRKMLREQESRRKPHQKPASVMEEKLTLRQLSSDPTHETMGWTKKKKKKKKRPTGKFLYDVTSSSDDSSSTTYWGETKVFEERLRQFDFSENADDETSSSSISITAAVHESLSPESIRNISLVDRSYRPNYDAASSSSDEMMMMATKNKSNHHGLSDLQVVASNKFTADTKTKGSSDEYETFDEDDHERNNHTLRMDLGGGMQLLRDKQSPIRVQKKTKMTPWGRQVWLRKKIISLLKPTREKESQQVDVMPSSSDDSTESTSKDKDKDKESAVEAKENSAVDEKPAVEGRLTDRRMLEIRQDLPTGYTTVLKRERTHVTVPDGRESSSLNRWVQRVDDKEQTTSLKFLTTRITIDSEITDELTIHPLVNVEATDEKVEWREVEFLVNTPEYLFIGGHRMDKAEGSRSPTLKLDVKQMRWMDQGKMPVARRNAAIVSNDCGEIFVTGGYGWTSKEEGARDRSERLECATDTVFCFTEQRGWTKIPPMRKARASHSAAICGEFLVVVGGVDEHERILSSVEGYQWADESGRGQWKQFAGLNTPRMGASIHVCDDGKTILLAGGLVESVAGESRKCAPTDSVLGYSLGSDSWHSLDPLRRPKAFASLIGNEDDLFLIGGIVAAEDETMVSSDEIELYKSDRQQWDVETRMSEARHSVATVFIGDYLMVIGGSQEPTNRTLVTGECYDVRARQWLYGMPKMPYPISSGMLVSLHRAATSTSIDGTIRSLQVRMQRKRLVDEHHEQ